MLIYWVLSITHNEMPWGYFIVLFKKSQLGLRLMRQSLKVFQEQKKLLILPLIGRSLLFLVLCGTSFLAWSIRMGKIDYQQLSTMEILIGYAILLLAFFLANILSTYFNTVLVFSLNQYDWGEKPQFKFAEAAQRLTAIVLWLSTHFTFGMAAKFFPQKFKKNRLLSGLHWSFAAFLLVPMMINESGGILKILKRSSQLMHTQFGSLPKINFSFFWIMISMRVLAFIPLIIAYSTREKIWILLGLILTGILIYIVMIFQNALYLWYSLKLYINTLRIKKLSEILRPAIWRVRSHHSISQRFKLKIL